jgi:cell division septum initiation protein DivIVA
MADFQTSEPPDPPLPQNASASERLREVSFPLAVRGYERAAVDDFVNAVRAMVAELEATQTREGVVQKALDDVGVETAGILQRAHEAADELTRRSRSDADDRLQRAESEADELRREADEYSEQVVVDTRLLWEDRQRLIEDIRRLADEVLATADDAMERVKMPEPLAAAEAEDARPPSGPVGVPAADKDEPAPFDTAEEDAPFALGEDTAAYELGEVEAEPAPYDAAVAGDAAPASDEELGRTVELEALQGGAGERAGEPDESHIDEGGGWERERD